MLSANGNDGTPTRTTLCFHDLRIGADTGSPLRFYGLDLTDGRTRWDPMGQGMKRRPACILGHEFSTQGDALAEVSYFGYLYGRVNPESQKVTPLYFEPEHSIIGPEAERLLTKTYRSALCHLGHLVDGRHKAEAKIAAAAAEAEQQVATLTGASA